MSSTISNGVTSVTPTLITSYEHRRAVRTLVHDVIGSAVPDVTMRPARTRSGTLTALCASREDATALDAMLASSSVLTVTSSDEARLDGLRLVVADGEVTVRLEGQRTWLVEWPYQEVT